MIFTAVQLIAVAIACTLAGLHATHVLQAQRYSTDALRRQLHRADELPLLHEVPVAVIAMLLSWYLPVLLSMAVRKEETRASLCGWVVLGLFCIAAAVVCLRKRSIPVQRPLRMTHRLLRLLCAVFLMNAAGIALLRLLGFPPYAMFAGSSYAALLAAMLLQPLEETLNLRRYAAARKKIAAHKNLICVGITGSYGKTEVKQILKAILSEKFKVLATPPGFSGIMGIARVANESLDKTHEIFIAEMGAQHRGEIRDMAKLMQPKYGVITCVEGEHLDSFGSMEAVAQAKSELLEALPKDGAAFFGADGSYGDRLYALYTGEKARAGVGTAADLWMRAEHIETGTKGTRFELVCRDGTHAWVQTQLLGSYAVRNIALCAAVAKKLGMRMEEIAKGAAKARPLKHHLQSIAGEVNVIDNSENTRPEAAVEALKVLADFPGRRILVTGGFPHLDDRVEDRAYAFGLEIPDRADYVILIDPDETKPIMSALLSKRFPKSSVRMVNRLEDAAAFVHEIAGAGDTVLYEGVYPEDE